MTGPPSREPLFFLKPPDGFDPHDPEQRAAFARRAAEALVAALDKRAAERDQANTAE
jgi:hypothetical protein